MRFLCLILLCTMMFACAHRQPVPAESIETSNALKAQSEFAQTVKGRLWINFHDRSHDFSFPAEIAIDRSVESASKMRLNVVGPFGATYLLMILTSEEGKSVLNWIDFKSQQKQTFHQAWNGLPLKGLTDLFLGTLPKDAKLNSEKMKVTVIRTESNGGIVVSKIESKTDGLSSAESYAVQYSDWSSSREFFLPKEIELSNGSGMLIKLTWRERQWNESLPAEAFLVPKLGF